MKKQEHIFSIDYYAYKSPLKKVNPGFKCLLSVGILSSCLLADNMAVSVYVMLSLAFLNVRAGRIGLGRYAELMAVPLVFIMLGCAAIAVDAGYGEHGWYISISRQGMVRSLGVMLRTFACVSALYLLSLSTPMNEIVSVLRKCRVPAVITELMNMIYRYIFILMDTQLRIRNSAQSRLGYSDFKSSCTTFGSSMGNLLVLSLKRAGMYYDAMESRCYDGELLFLEEERRLKARYFLWAILYLSVIPLIKWYTEMRGWL